jgi:mono/diheme cytochrome c family protein
MIIILSLVPQCGTSEMFSTFIMKYNREYNMKRLVSVVGLMSIFLLGSYIATSVIFAGGTGQAQSSADYQEADLKNGAQLYDNWLKSTEIKTSENHPLYPQTSKKSGKATWRCKECHGWDYIGNKGRYSKGSHFTGITGVFHVQRKNPEVLYSSMTNKNAEHDFSEYLSESQILDLVKFLREGQAAIDPVIDSQGKGKGNSTHGKVLYEAHCSDCHGSDGNEIDFKGNKEGVQGIGWLTNDNPQESIHKIRWGHPGSDMPSMTLDKNLSEQDSIDILTYSQLLDSK